MVKLLKKNNCTLSAADKVVQVISTLAIENMQVDNTARENLILMATRQKSSTEVIAELKRKYAR